MRIDNEKWDELIQSLENGEDEIYTFNREKGFSPLNLYTCNYGAFIRFKKIMYRVFRKVDIKSPIAMRLFLYFIEFNIGYSDDPKYNIPLNRKTLMRECNIKNGKSLYEGIRSLQDRNMIFIIEKFNEGGNERFIRVNPSIKFWEVEEGIRDREYRKEVERQGNPSD